MLGQLARSLAPPGATSEREPNFATPFWELQCALKCSDSSMELATLFLEVCRSSPATGLPKYLTTVVRKNRKIVLFHLILLQTFVRLLETYAGVYGLPQPVPSRGNHASDQPIIHLPASHPKTKIHQLCSTALSHNEPLEDASYRTFRRIWKLMHLASGV